jgi:putative Holliday junction resolvase
MRTLGIDFGSKRIGIALSDETGQFALPYSVVSNGPQALTEIQEICALNNVSTIVIGESKNFDGKENPIMNEIHEFIEKLKEHVSFPIILHPEFMTSAQAEHIQGKNDMLDASAAAVILGSYLDMKQNHDNNR